MSEQPDSDVAELLETLRGTYPGSRHPLRDQVQPAPPVPATALAWDARPFWKVVNGQRREFFTIGALAKALGRELVTVRQWEAKGRIPQATFRLPNTNGLGGRRLYTRAQIEAVLRLLDAHQILDSPRVDWTQHTTLAAEIRRAWVELTTAG